MSPSAHPRAPREQASESGLAFQRHFVFWLGFVGLLVAVPLAATIGVLTRFALRRYLASSLYTGEKSG